MTELNESQLQFFRCLIAERLQALDDEDVLGASGQSVVTLDQQSVGRLSRQDALQNQAMAKALSARRTLQRRGLHAALERLNEGEFGYCEDCGNGIAEARLRANPTVARCIECAS